MFSALDRRGSWADMSDSSDSEDYDNQLRKQTDNTRCNAVAENGQDTFVKQTRQLRADVPRCSDTSSLASTQSSRMSQCVNRLLGPTKVDADYAKRLVSMNQESSRAQENAGSHKQVDLLAAHKPYPSATALPQTIQQDSKPPKGKGKGKTRTPNDGVSEKLTVKANKLEDKLEKTKKLLASRMETAVELDEVRKFIEQATKNMTEQKEALEEELKITGARTVMIKNIPNDYRRWMLTDLLDEKGFKARYDFVYLPFDFDRKSGVGYAFVNMESFEACEELKGVLNGFNNWKRNSQKVAEVKWGEAAQGKAENIDRFRNSPVMHEDVNVEYKPAIYENGEEVPFPEPTKVIHPPQIRRSKDNHPKGMR